MGIKKSHIQIDIEIKERRKELIQGNIKVDNFVDVWENKFDYFRDKKNMKSNKCKKCKNWKWCL